MQSFGILSHLYSRLTAFSGDLGKYLCLASRFLLRHDLVHLLDGVARDTEFRVKLNGKGSWPAMIRESTFLESFGLRGLLALLPQFHVLHRFAATASERFCYK